MSFLVEIPLSPQPQRFSIVLAGVERQFRLTWCAPAAAWVLDLYDSDGTPMALGLMLTTGADLLEQFGYLELGFELAAFTDHNLEAVPTFANLGLEGHLWARVEDVV